MRRGDRLIILTGAPGCGKTTACRRLLAQPPPKITPFDISKQVSLRFGNISAFLSNELRVRGTLMDLVQRSADMLLVVDGLGERNDAEHSARSILALSRRFSHTRFLVTCRDNDYVDSWLPCFTRWCVQRLSAESQDMFIKSQPVALQERFARVFSADGHLREILSNQFLLLLAADLMDDPEGVQPALTRTGLYEAFLDGFLQDWEEVKVGQRDFVVAVLQEIAINMRRKGHLRSHIAEPSVISIIGDYLGKRGTRQVERDVQETLRELYRHGLIVRECGLVGFFQETFQEFLCAKWLRDQRRALPNDFRREQDDVWFEDIRINEVIMDFYREMAGIGKPGAVQPTACGLAAVSQNGEIGMTTKPQFDVFLSHNGKDKPTVRDLKQRLTNRRLKVWLDEDELRPGIPWQQLLEEGIKTSRSVAVLVGADGLGPWEDEEMQAALSLAVKDKRSVIPVLLPSAPRQPSLPMFLGNRTWVDLRTGFAGDGVDRLEWGITGLKPNP